MVSSYRPKNNTDCEEEGNESNGGGNSDDNFDIATALVSQEQFDEDPLYMYDMN